MSLEALFGIVAGTAAGLGTIKGLSALGVMEVGSGKWEDAVLAEIVRQYRGAHFPGARYPSPVPLRYMGGLTDAAKRLGFTKDNHWKTYLKIGDSLLNREDMVHLAIKDMIDTGTLVVFDRYDYSWIIPKNMTDLHDRPLYKSNEVRKDGKPDWAPSWWDEA